MLRKKGMSGWGCVGGGGWCDGNRIPEHTFINY